ncbi:hypothetical protein R6Q59_025533 [Mikania micrantha]
MAQTYGPLMLIHLGTVPVLVASSVDAAKEIMKTHDLVFASRPQLDIPSRIFYGNKDIAFSQYGEYWRQIKSIAVLHLLSNKRVQSYQHVRSDEMGLMMDKILRSNGSVLNLSELIIALTNNVVCRVALGRTYEGRKFKNLLQRAMELLGCFSVGSYIPSLKWVDRLSGLVRKADDVAKELDEFLEGPFRRVLMFELFRDVEVALIVRAAMLGFQIAKEVDRKGKGRHGFVCDMGRILDPHVRTYGLNFRSKPKPNAEFSLNNIRVAQNQTKRTPIETIQVSTVSYHQALPSTSVDSGRRCCYSRWKREQLTGILPAALFCSGA